WSSDVCSSDLRRAAPMRRGSASVLRGLVLIGLAAVSWGTTGSVTTILIARSDAEPLLIGAARMWVAALVLVAGATAVGAGPTRTARALPHCLAMGACMALYQAA